MKVHHQLSKKYSDQYDSEDDQWRMIGGRGKANNIMAIAKDINVQKVLDVGSGDGSVLFWLDKYNFSNEIHAAEISQSGIEKIKSKNLESIKEIVLFDGYKLPFENNVFDLAICSHVIEHVEYPRMLIREICRVSKKQIFEVPIDFSLNVDSRVDFFMSYGHVNIYTPQTLRFLLKSEGLKIEEFHNNLYDKAVDDYQNQDKSSLVKIKTLLKRVIRKYIPFMMQIKPHTTTVRTSKLTSGVEIMKTRKK
jgi:ubiquinone/menaquinone biosynthesis C-methylase UbiE